MCATDMPGPWCDVCVCVSTRFADGPSPSARSSCRRPEKPLVASARRLPNMPLVLRRSGFRVSSEQMSSSLPCPADSNSAASRSSSSGAAMVPRTTSLLSGAVAPGAATHFKCQVESRPSNAQVGRDRWQPQPPVTPIVTVAAHVCV
jgi:hypothetical protein